jgi:hypothetical protein
MSKHTPTPWTVPDGGIRPAIYTADEVEHIATMADTGDEMEANAAFIVRAVNSHDALVEALLEVRKCGNGGAKLSRAASDKARAALRAAGVEP